MNSKFFRNIFCAFTLAGLLGLGACSDYLDVVPEGTGRLENVFTSRESTLRFMYSNYSFLQPIDPMSGMEVCAVGELWTGAQPTWPGGGASHEAIKIAMGKQSPFVNLWYRWTHMYAGINNCNTIISGLETYKVPDLPKWEKDQWIAENKVLKAWFHFYLLRLYGPIPIIRENLPISTSVEEVQVPRDPVDECFNYILQLLDEAIPYLTNEPSSTQDYGRIDRAIAMSVRAEVAVTAASPLFNNNAEFAPMKNKDGEQLFHQGSEEEGIAKWQRAVQACDTAVQFCMGTRGMELYQYPGHPQYDLTPTMMQQMTLRQAFCERWSSEVIWAYTKSWVHDLQYRATRGIGPYGWAQTYGVWGAPFSVVEQFYSKNGVPISEDKNWNYNSRYELRQANSSENLYIRERETTARMNFDREPRFYAWLNFDRGVMYGWNKEDDSKPSELLYYRQRKGEPQGGDTYDEYEGAGGVTGYLPKKYLHYKSWVSAENTWSSETYIWPLIRLPELLLFYAEALNEASNTPEAREKAMQYVDMIRGRAGLGTIADSWQQYSNNPAKYQTQDGLREIIRQERSIELAFEGQRYYDLRRWKTAPEILNGPVQGWDLGQRTAENYYRPTILYEQTFGLKDYFFPLADDELRRNTNLVQSLGW